MIESANEIFICLLKRDISKKLNLYFDQKIEFSL